MRRLPLALHSFAAALCIIIGTQRADAQTLISTSDVPRTLSYQGLLTSTDGTPVHDGEYRITLALYADPAGTIKVWEDTYATPITDGLFNVYLGSGNMRLPDPGTMNRPLWVGTRIDDTDEMRPLTPLSASPYALNVPDRAITTGKLADGAVTADKVDMDYIAGIAVNGQPVAAKGSLLNIEGSGDIALTYNDETNTLRLSKPTPATRGDNEKGTSALANQDQVWSANGDGWDVGAGTTYTPVSGDWIGTSSTSGETFVLKTNSQTAMRYQPSGTSTPNVLGGSGNNTISSASVGSVIAGGGSAGIINQITNNATYAVIGGGSYHTVSADHATVGGGRQNQVSADYATAAGGAYHIVSGEYAIAGGGAGNTASGSHAAVLGGESNTASGLWTVVGGGSWNAASGPHAAIAGGSDNTASADHATIGGGYDNVTEGTYSLIGGGDSNIISTANYTTIGGGQYNRIQYDAHHSAIVGGRANRIDPEYQWSFIGGGDSNVVEGSYVVIGGGEDNRAAGFHVTIGGGAQQTAIGHNSTIAGGENNYITGNGVDGFIGGGRNHFIHNSMAVIGGGSYDTVTGYGAIIGGGSYNKALADYSSILGGDSNTISARSSVIGGGYDNLVEGKYALIGGGDSNTVLAADYTGITGGQYNKIQYDADHSAIVGGRANLIEPESQWAFIGGGDSNTIEGSYAVIGGGEDNEARNFYTTIGGGIQNTIAAYSGTIGGGENNTMLSTANKSFIGGGANHRILNDHSTIAGGHLNYVAGHYSTIGGGDTNTVMGDYATIGGGYDNNADANYTTVAGGRRNVISSSSTYSTIGGGYNNNITGSYAVIGGGDEHLASAINTTIAGGWDHTASGSYSTVGGGRRNVAAGNYSVIPGGDSLQTNSYAQTAVGFYNAPRTVGNISARPTAAANALNNNPIFMVGNGGSGGAATRTNAFEVSYNGHSTVYGTNNITNVVATPTIYGATYTDNILYAWGDIGIGGGGAPIPNGVFGVQNIARLGAGIYQITITVVDPVTSAPIFLDDASIVATLVAENPEQFPCGTIAVTRLDGQNRFKVCTKDAACQAVDLPFMFHLTGRNR